VRIWGRNRKAGLVDWAGKAPIQFQFLSMPSDNAGFPAIVRILFGPAQGLNLLDYRLHSPRDCSTITGITLFGERLAPGIPGNIRGGRSGPARYDHGTGGPMATDTIPSDLKQRGRPIEIAKSKIIRNSRSCSRAYWTLPSDTWKSSAGPGTVPSR